MKRIEDIVAKGEIAHHEQFLLLSQYFQKLYVAEPSEREYYMEGRLGCKCTLDVLSRLFVSLVFRFLEIRRG